MRVPNHKLDGYLARREVVENYNGTIRTNYTSYGAYEVWHWNTRVAEVSADGVVWFVPYSISQTSSTLIGRFMRSQPRDGVVAWIESEYGVGNISAKRRRQLLKQLW